MTAAGMMPLHRRLERAILEQNRYINAAAARLMDQSANRARADGGVEACIFDCICCGKRARCPGGGEGLQAKVLAKKASL